MLLIIVLLIIVRAVFRISKLIYSSLPSGTLIAPVPSDCQPGVLPSIPHHFLLIKRKAGICSIYGFYTWVYVWESCLHAQWGRWEGALSPPVHLAQEQLPSCTLCWVRAELWKPQPGPSWTSACGLQTADVTLGRLLEVRADLPHTPHIRWRMCFPQFPWSHQSFFHYNFWLSSTALRPKSLLSSAEQEVCVSDASFS